ncbi:MAG: hypothetical protein B7Z55_09870, partial [Planctomycetales bacterium 12-60-4]
MSQFQSWGLAVVVVAMGTAFASTAEAQWGDIKGRVILVGDDIPDAKKLLIRMGDASVKDAAVCAAVTVPNEDLLVDPATKGVANIAVYMRKAPSKVHPDLKPATTPVVYDQKNCQFTPHVAIVHAGQSVEILNSDPIAHNTRNAPIKNMGFNFIVPPNTAKGAGVVVPKLVAENVPLGI